jgi:hypothetical protein
MHWLAEVQVRHKFVAARRARQGLCTPSWLGSLLTMFSIKFSFFHQQRAEIGQSAGDKLEAIR